jgi:hypothetical protein
MNEQGDGRRAVPDRPGDAGQGDPDATAAMSPSEIDDDATQAMKPADDATQAMKPADDDATRAVRAPGGHDDDDKTMLTPAVDEDATKVTPVVDSDATAMLPPTPIGPPEPPTTILRPQVPDSTSTMPPADDPQRWTAKANVPRTAPRDPDATAQWSPPEPGRAWWLPILLGVIGLLILLAVAYFLITHLNNDNTQPSPPPAPTQSAAPSSTPPSTPPTSAPPTTATPTQPGAPFVVPSLLIGLPVDSAASILDGYGIAYTEVAQTDDSALPNTVVRTSPDVGQTVAPGGSITLYYAQPSAPTPTGTPTTATPSPSPSPGG